jgi:Spy/CpxP family protein refolding chaperone
MMIMRTTILSLAFLLMTVLGLNAQPGNQRNQGMRPGMKNQMPMMSAPQRIAKELNLTNEQKDAFKKILLAMQKEIKPIRNEIGEAAAHLKTLTSADKPDINAINKSIDKIGALKIEIAKIRLKNRLDMRALLTDEQRMKAEAMKAKMKRGMGQRFGRQGMGMGPNKGMQQ